MSNKEVNIGIIGVFLVVAVVTWFAPATEQLPYWNASGAAALALGGALAAFRSKNDSGDSQRDVYGMGLIAIGGIMVAVATLRPLLAP